MKEEDIINLDLDVNLIGKAIDKNREGAMLYFRQGEGKDIKTTIVGSADSLKECVFSVMDNNRDTANIFMQGVALYISDKPESIKSFENFIEYVKTRDKKSKAKSAFKKFLKRINL